MVGGSDFSPCHEQESWSTEGSEKRFGGLGKSWNDVHVFAAARSRAIRASSALKRMAPVDSAVPDVCIAAA